MILPIHVVDASLEGLERQPCHTLVLAVRYDGKPLHGMAAEIDWRMAGRLSRWVQCGLCCNQATVLMPAPPTLLVSRLIVWPCDRGVTGIAASVQGLGDGPFGICPADFGMDPTAMIAALSDSSGRTRWTIYGSHSAENGSSPVVPTKESS